MIAEFIKYGIELCPLNQVGAALYFYWEIVAVPLYR